MDELTENQKKYRRRRTPAYLIKAAERARQWRAENREKHRAAERERYKKLKSEDPEGLRKQRTENMRKWRAENRERANATTRRSNAKNKEKLRCRRYQKKYGLTAEQCDELFQSQGSKCAICKLPDSPRGWCIDHCHTTGKVRGVLCHDCNTGLGFFKDNADSLQSAIYYLER